MYEFMDYDETDDDINVCVSCGDYYATTQRMIDYWKANIMTDVMPQQCNQCLKGLKDE